jgi:hypothetical protein
MSGKALCRLDSRWAPRARIGTTDLDRNSPGDRTSRAQPIALPWMDLVEMDRASVISLPSRIPKVPHEERVLLT